MKSEVVLILDRAVVHSLWIFLVSFVALLIYARFRLRARLKKVEDLFRKDSSEPVRDDPTRLPVNEWQLAVRTLLVSLFLALAFFFVFMFTPLPIFDNFSAADSWRITPLRVTAVTYDRTYEGFSIEGEVWNQTADPLLQLRTLVSIWGTDDKLLDEVEVLVEPAALPGGTYGTFRLEYNENSPFIKGYQVSFVSQDGRAIPHVMGFDAE